MRTSRQLVRSVGALGLLALACLLACLPGHPSIVGGRTNVVLVVIDTLRADHLTAWGYPHPTSPNLDRLAAEGVRFSRFFSNASWTRPAMASLLTGLYPRSTGIYEERFDRLADELTTLPELLRQRGYRTIGLTANPNIDAWFGFDQGFDSYGDSGVVWSWMPATDERPHYKRGETDVDRADVVTDRALSAIDRAWAEDDRGPFYLQVLYIDPHRPWNPPRRHKKAVAGSSNPGYDGEIRFVDAEIQRLLDGLDERDLFSDTLVVVTSDHGEGLRDHPNVPLSHTHGSTLYDSVLSVPLILSHPSLPAGRVVETLASSIDLLPTIMELLGWTDALPALPGRSLVDSIFDPAASSTGPALVIAETDWRVNSKISARTGEHRFVLNRDSFHYQVEGIHEGGALDEDQQRQLASIPVEELYEVRGNQREDPSRNLLAARPDLRAELAMQLADWESSIVARTPLGRDPEDTSLPTSVELSAPSTGAESEPPAPDAETLDRLQALGYLDP